MGGLVAYLAMFLEIIMLFFLVPLHCYHTIFTCHYLRKVMVRVDAKQGAPKDGNSTIELLQVIIVLFEKDIEPFKLFLFLRRCHIVRNLQLSH